MDEKQNLWLWKRHYQVPEEHLKKVVGRQYQGSSPRAQWVYQALTETFGPAGTGWGYKILETGIVPPPVEGADAVQWVRVGLWYRLPQEQGKSELVEAIGATTYGGFRKDGKPFVDDDAFKKSTTDAITKAASVMGIAGEVYMGDLERGTRPASKTHSPPVDNKYTAVPWDSYS